MAVIGRNQLRTQLIPFFAFYVACTLPLCLLGFGSDNDTYLVLDAGRATWAIGKLQTSRNPGYWLYEAVVYVISCMGGYVATNVASLLLGAFILWRLLLICERLQIRNRFLLVSCAIATPVFLIACSSTIDYVWSAACLIIALEAMTSSRFLPAIVAGVLAIGFRPSNSVVLGGMYAGILLYLVITERKSRILFQMMISGVATVSLSALFFIPSFLLAHHSMAFLAPMAGPADMWTWKMHAGRFFYKTLYLFGPLASCFLLLSFIFRRKTLILVHCGRPLALLITGLIGGCAAGVVLFAKFPIEISYLLPAMIFFLPLAGLTILNKRSILAVFLVLVALSNFVLVSLAKPNIAGRSTDAKIQFALAAGTLIEDCRSRLRLRSCETYNCWESIMPHPI
jgi:hypothetical protein